MDWHVDHFGGDAGFDMGLRTGQFGVAFDGMDVEDDERTARLDVLAFFRGDLLDGRFADPHVTDGANAIRALLDFVDGIVHKLLNTTNFRLLDAFRSRRRFPIVFRRMDGADGQGEHCYQD